MHPPEVKQEALRLVAEGLNDCEIGRRLGIPRSTILEWRRPSYVARGSSPPHTSCPRCWGPAKPMTFTPADYSELLAVYLGDGSISTHPRTQRLRVALDLKYPGIIADVRALLEQCFPYNNVDEVQSIGCVHVSLYSTHLSCIFPQHGPGMKHQRPIILERWQREHVETEPWPFIRGCIRTDGCAFINRTNVHREQPYEYLSYQFSNMSGDIVGLFVDACSAVGVFTRLNCDARGRWDVRINRRASVELMVEHVGLKH